MDRLLNTVRLWPASGSHDRRVTWLELFFDLVFVATIAQLGNALAHDYSLRGLLRFAFMFVLVWWAWHGHTLYCTRYKIDDGLQRFLTLLQIFAAAAMAANARASLDSRESAGFAAAYAGLRVILVVQYVRTLRIAKTRRHAALHVIGFSLAATLWITAAVAPLPSRYYLWAVALAIDLLTPALAGLIAYRQPHDPAHLPERFGLFTIILLGEMVAAVMRGMEMQESWPVPAVVAAFAGLFIAFTVWWWYFDTAQASDERHVRASEHHRFRLWNQAHVFLYIGIAAMGVGMEHIIALKPSGHFGRDEEFMFVGSVALVMGMLVVISATSEHPSKRATRLWAAAMVGGIPLVAVALAHAAQPQALVPLVAILMAAQVLTLSLQRRGSHADHGVVLAESKAEA